MFPMHLQLQGNILERNDGHVFGFTDSLAINFKKQINSGKNQPVSKAEGKGNRISPETTFSSEAMKDKD